MVPVGSPEGTKGRLLTAENAVGFTNSYGCMLVPFQSQLVLGFHIVDVFSLKIP